MGLEIESSNQDIEKRESWEEFQRSGLLYLVNRVLTPFGWSIIFLRKPYGGLEVFPARVKSRSLTKEQREEGDRKLSRYFDKNNQAG